jgi:hypothetical protein
MHTKPFCDHLLDAQARMSAAWNTGYCLVAERLNAVLRGHRIGVQIAAAPRSTGMTLARCRKDFADALLLIRPYLPDSVGDPMLRPWTVGRIHNPSDGPDPRVDIGGPEDADAELAGAIHLLRTFRRAWSLDKWSQKVVQPVEQHAQRWHAWFDEVRAHLESMLGIGLAGRQTGIAPAQLIDGPRTRRDKWLYEQTCRGIPHIDIVSRLKRKPTSWPRISTIGGVRSAARRYAKRMGLKPPPLRRPGRRSRSG